MTAANTAPLFDNQLFQEQLSQHGLQQALSQSLDRANQLLDQQFRDGDVASPVRGPPVVAAGSTSQASDCRRR